MMWLFQFLSFLPFLLLTESRTPLPDENRCRNAGGYCADLVKCNEGEVSDPTLCDLGSCCLKSQSNCTKTGGQCYDGVKECPPGTFLNGVGCPISRNGSLCCIKDSSGTCERAGGQCQKSCPTPNIVTGGGDCGGVGVCCQTLVLGNCAKNGGFCLDRAPCPNGTVFSNYDCGGLGSCCVKGLEPDCESNGGFCYDRRKTCPKGTRSLFKGRGCGGFGICCTCSPIFIKR